MQSSLRLRLKDIYISVSNEREAPLEGAIQCFCFFTGSEGLKFPKLKGSYVSSSLKPQG